MAIYTAILTRAHQDHEYPLVLPIDVWCSELHAVFIREYTPRNGDVSTTYAYTQPHILTITLAPQPYKPPITEKLGVLLASTTRRRPDAPDRDALLTGICGRLGLSTPPDLSYDGDRVQARYALSKQVRLLDIVSRGLRGPPYYDDADATLAYTTNSPRSRDAARSR